MICNASQLLPIGTESVGGSISQNSSLSRTTTPNSSNSSSGYVGGNSILRPRKIYGNGYSNNNCYLRNQKSQNHYGGSKLKYSNSFCNQRSLLHTTSAR